MLGRGESVSYLFHPVADIFPMMSEQEYADLVEDVRQHGLREPVWLHRDGRIIDGRNRWRACQETGQELLTRTYEGDDSSLVSFVLSLNLHRRHLNESQRAMVAAKVANLEHGQRADRAANLPVSQADAASMLSVSERSVRSAQAVREHGIPELAAKVEAGEIAVSTAAVIASAPAEVQREVIAADDEKEIIRRAKEIQQRRKEERIAEKAKAVAEIAARNPSLPLNSMGPFPVLYADPPWRYDFAEDTGRQIENHYPTMTLDEIKKLEVPAADDCVLFVGVVIPLWLGPCIIGAVLLARQ